MFNNVGFIGSGPLTQALAHHLVAAQIPVLISNSRGPHSLTELVAELGDAAQAVTVERAAKWVRRRPGVAELLATLALVTALGVGGVVWKYRDAETQRRKAEGLAEDTTFVVEPSCTTVWVNGGEPLLVKFASPT